MIKFNCIIHKETGHIIKYDEWLEKVKKYEEIRFFIKDDGEYIYDSKTILYEDHFEIIYESNFNTKSLYTLYRHEKNVFIKDEIGIELKYRQDIEDKYGIEV